MLQESLTAILRTAGAFFMLLLVTRIIGRKIIAQMTFFDFCIAITLGSIGADMGLGLSGDDYLTSVVVLFTFAVLGLLSEVFNLKSFLFRKIVDSEPLILVQNGEINKSNMKKAKISLMELNALLREKDAFNILDVNFAILENDGKFSVLKKADKQNLTPYDMQQKPSETGLSRELIIDGNIMYENLSKANMTEKQLLDELKKMSINSEKEVFFASIDNQNNLYVSKGIMGQEQHGQHGIE